MDNNKNTSSLLISVIVPVFNVEKYLSECIESILKQTYRNLEIILVEDGSPDRCGAICDEFAAKDDRIKVIHQENGGVTKARAAGFGISGGDLVCFVDSDDSLPEDAIQTLYLAMTPDVDIVVGKSSFSDDKECFQLSVPMGRMSYQQQMVKNLLPCSLWAKLYRRDLFSSEVFNIPRNIIIGEDWLMNSRLAFSLNRDVCFIDHVVYNYRTNPQSVTQVKKTDFEYEESFYRIYMTVIPEPFLTPRFFKNIIYARLKTFYMNTSYRFPDKEYPFITQLRADVVAYHYRLPLGCRVLLYNENTVIRCFFILLRKILSRVFGMNRFFNYDDTEVYKN